MTVIAGIDVGLSGAICLFCVRDIARSSVHDTPTLALTRGGKNKRDLDARALAALLADHRIEHVFVEQVGAMPGQGVTSMFAFGKSYGIVLGILAGLRLPYTLVPPRRWKTALGVPAGKDGARARASQLLPALADQWPLKKHDGRAEAALICLWGAKNFRGELRPEEPQMRVAGAAGELFAEPAA